MPVQKPDWLEQIDHTADAGIAVQAPNPCELFERAAWGMFSFITNIEAVEAEESISVEIEAEDRNALLVKWLSELNFLHITQHRVFSKFDITEWSDTRLVGEVKGEGIDHDRHTIYTEIKAVTYHDLNVEETDDGWKAEIIFDL